MRKIKNEFTAKEDVLKGEAGLFAVPLPLIAGERIFEGHLCCVRSNGKVYLVNKEGILGQLDDNI